MSQDQSLSTEDLAGRQAPDRSEPAAPPAATGAPDMAQATPPDSVGDRRWTDDTDRMRTAGADDHSAGDHYAGDPNPSDPSASGHDVSDPGITLSAPGVSDPGVSDPGAGDYRDASVAGRDAGAADDGQRRPDDEDVSLVDDAQADDYRARWADVQVRFVDDPREAVGAADALVAEAMQSLASAFADHKSRLETQWNGGGDVDTEELRVALRRYRAFFHRLLET